MALIFYLLGSLEMVAEELEAPFGKKENDRPYASSQKISGKRERHIWLIINRILQLRSTWKGNVIVKF